MGSWREQAEAAFAKAEALKPKPQTNGNGNGHHAPPLPEASEQAEIARLAKLTPTQYDRERINVAKLLGIRPATLDRAVSGSREKPDGKQGCPLMYPEVEPWPEAVDISQALEETARAIRRYIDLRPDAIDAVALWTAHTYLTDVFYHSPRLAISSPEKQCGKSTLSDVLTGIVYRPEKAVMITGAALFRTIGIARPTMILDEMDNSIKDNLDLRAVLNDGHRKDGNTLRCVGDDQEPRRFSTYCACSIALIGKLPDTLADRSIHIEMRRRLPDVQLESLRGDRKLPHFESIKSKLTRWSQDVRDTIAALDPQIPSGMYNRQADNWRPLFSIAQMAGGEWPIRAERAARLTGGSETGVRTLLLADVRDICAARGRETFVLSSEVAAGLAEMEGRPWPEFGKSRRPITANNLARMLAPFGIVPMKSNGQKGYRLSLMEDAIARYLRDGGNTVPTSPDTNEHSQALGDLGMENPGGLL